MNDEMAKLRDVLEVQNGFAFKTGFFSVDEGIPLIRIRDLGTDKTETRINGDFREEFIVEPGDYLIGMDGNFRCRRWNGPRALLNQRVCRLRNFSPAVLPEYIFFGIQPQLESIEASTAFATVKHISARQILDIEIPFPTLEEQRRIVDLLSRAEGIVRLRREAQKKAEELIPALFADMFGDPAINPKGWPESTLGEVLDCADYGSSKKASSDGAGLPLIRMGNVDYAGNLDLSDLKYVELSPDDEARFRLEEGDILFNRTNSKELVGKTALWESPFQAVAASYFIRLRLVPARARPIFVWSFMNTPYMKRVLFDTARGAIGQANINSKELKGFRIFLPDLVVQTRFEVRCRDALAIRAQQASATGKAEATFNALLARAFSDVRQQAPAQPEVVAGA